MADEILRLGLETRGVEEGARRADQAYERVEQGAREASNANEALERRMKQTADSSARATAALEQSARANRAQAQATRTAAEMQEVYRRAAQERLQTEREVARMASGPTAVSATAAAESFIRAQEAYYQQNMARVRLAVVRGLITPEEAALQGRQAAEAYNTAIAGVLERRPQFANDRQAFTALAGSLKDVEDAGRRGSLGMHRLNNSLIVMARQATNTHPVVGQLADVVGTFAIGTASMVPILAGVAALGFAWQRLTRDAREAKEEHERLMKVLDDLRERQRIEDLGPGGEFIDPRAAAFGDVQRIAGELAAERARLDALRAQVEQRGPRAAARLGPQIMGAEGRIAALEEQYATAIERARAGERGITEAQRDAEEERLRELKRAEAERARVRREGVELHKWLIQIEKDAERARAEERREEHQEKLRLLQIERDAEARRANERRREFEIEQQVRAVVRRREEEERRKREQAERELEQARERALNNLVQALNNVGRAYGGVTDQVLSLVSAVLSLERMPMGTTRDRLTAYGTAAATGIGIGYSTADPFLGAAGGAAAGFAMAGPVGAVVGGVAGIVSGLIEQGRRAEQAAREWDQAMERWEKAYQDRTPFQQRMDQLGTEFGAISQQAAAAAGVSLSGPLGLEEARAFIAEFGDHWFGPFRDYADLLEEAIGLYEQNADAIREWQQAQQDAYMEDLRVRELRAQGRDAEADALEREIARERELERITKLYGEAAAEELRRIQLLEEERRAIEETNAAIRDTTSALNAPSGLRLSLHRWRAEFMLEPSADTRRPRDGGSTGGGTNRPGDRPDRRDVTVNVTINDSPDPRRTAREVIREVQRYAGTGGGNPLDDPTIR